MKRLVSGRSWIVAGALALFLAVAGTGTSYALWSAQASASGSVTVGAVGIAVTGGDTLAHDYSPALLQQNGSIVVANTGSVPITYATKTAMLSGSSTTMAGHVVVTTWNAGAAADCAATAPPAAVVKTWSTVPAMTGSLAAGASTVWCVRTSLTAAQLVTDATASVLPSIVATATAGTWTASSTTTAKQAVAKPVIPETSCDDILFNLAISLTWARPATAPANATYGVFVNGVKVAGPLSGATMTQILTNSQITATIVPKAGPTTVEIRQLLTGTATTLAYSTPITVAALSTERIPHCA